MKLLFLSLIFGISTALADTETDALFLSCLNLVGPYNYACDGRDVLSDENTASPCNCYSPAFLATYVDCISSVQKGNKKRALESLVIDCADSNTRTDLTPEILQETYTNETNNFIDFTTYDNQTETSNPLRFPLEDINLYYRSYRADAYCVYSSQLYGGLINAYFAFVLLIATMSNLLRRCAPGLIHIISRHGSVLWVRKNFANPALISYNHNVPIKWGPINMSLPTRAQGWVLAGYFSMFIIFMFIKYDIFEGDVLYSTKRSQLLQFVAVRSGLLAVSQLPLLFLFAGRNNMLLWVTGLSYDTMNVYHRWIARVLTAGAFIHAICFSLYYQDQNEYPQFFDKDYNRFGAVAVVSVFFIVFFSLRHFREHVYEFFLTLHWIFVVAFTIGAWNHLDEVGYIEWLYAAVAVWAFDHALRLARIVLNGVKAYGNAQLHPQNLIKMKVRYTNFWRPKAGSYVFVHFLSLWGFWESHPFSIYPSFVEGEEDVLVLCMRVRKGKTRQIEKFLEKQPNGFKSLPVFIDGPYGHSLPIQNSETIVLISGGIGFTAMYSYACSLMVLDEKKRITFIWSIRNSENLETFKEELAHLSNNSNISLVLYITNEIVGLQSNVNLQDIEKDGISDALIDRTSREVYQQKFQVNFGRPNIDAIMDAAIAEAPGSIGFAVCGPERMNDDVRFYGTKYMGKGRGRVDVYIEAFNW